MWDGAKRRRASPERAGTSSESTSSSQQGPAGSQSRWKRQATALQEAESPKIRRKPKYSRQKSEPWGASLLKALPQPFKDLAVRWGFALSDKQHPAAASLPASSQSESITSRRRQASPSEWTHESPAQKPLELQLCLSLTSSSVGVAGQEPSASKSCSPRAAIIGCCGSMDKESFTRLHAQTGGHTWEEAHFLEFIATGEAAGYASTQEAAASEKKTLKTSNAVLLQAIQEPPSPLRRFTRAEDIALARAVLAGSALPRVHSVLSVLGAHDLLEGLAFGNVAGAQPLKGVISASQAVLCNLFCLCRRAQLDTAAVSSCPSVLMTILWILLSFQRSAASAATVAVECMQATDASKLALWKAIMVGLQPILLERMQWKLLIEVEEMVCALDLLRNCTSVSALEQTRNTEPQLGLLDTPALQLRTSALHATADLLKDVLPGLPALVALAALPGKVMSSQSAGAASEAHRPHEEPPVPQRRPASAAACTTQPGSPQGSMSRGPAPAVVSGSRAAAQHRPRFRDSSYVLPQPLHSSPPEDQTRDPNQIITAPPTPLLDMQTASDGSDPSGRPGKKGASASIAEEGFRQERAGGMRRQPTGFLQQPADGHNLGMNWNPLQHHRMSEAGLQRASMPGQHIRQQPSPTQQHYTQRSAGPRQYQQIADAMRRGHAQQARTSPAPSPRQHLMPPVQQHLGPVQYMYSSVQTYQMQQSAPVMPTWAYQDAQGSIGPHPAAMMPGAALTPVPAPVEARDLYSHLCMQQDASLYHRQAFAASLSEIFQREPGSRRPSSAQHTAPLGPERNQHGAAGIPQPLRAASLFRRNLQAHLSNAQPPYCSHAARVLAASAHPGLMHQEMHGCPNESAASGADSTRWSQRSRQDHGIFELQPH